MSEGSLAVAKNKIDAYNLEEQVETFRSFDGKQLGDPSKLARVLIQITQMSNPPIHLPLGSDSYNAILGYRAKEQDELKKWKDLSLSTDF